MLLLFPFLGSVHLFDWDEINFAEIAREMLVTGKWWLVQIDFVPFEEKPPLFAWLQALSMHLFGVSEFAARFPNALCGVFTLLALYHLGRRLKDGAFGLLWVLCYGGSWLPFFYFKSGIIDPWFNLFIFGGVWFAAKPYLGKRSPSPLNFFLSGLFIGLAVLTKGPVGLLLFGATLLAYLGWHRFRNFPTVGEQGAFAAGFLMFGGVWFVLELLQGREETLLGFLRYHIRLLTTPDAGHGGPFFYHFLVLLVGVFPASVFALGEMRKSPDEGAVSTFRHWMLLLLAVVLIVFSLVQTKILHYSSLAYFPISFLAALYLRRRLDDRAVLPGWMRGLGTFLGVALGLLLVALPLFSRFKERILATGWIRDPFALGNLQAEVEWQGWEFLIGVVFLEAAAYFFGRKKPATSRLLLLFPLTALTVFLSLAVLAPRVEAVTQRAAIEFYESLQGADAYVYPLGFKSYAHLFYTRKGPETALRGRPKEWLLSGSIDKPAYFVCKVHRLEQYLKTYPELEVLDRRNGYIFLRRQPPKAGSGGGEGH